jgi:predicted DNA-binding WGR domain protein
MKCWCGRHTLDIVCTSDLGFIMPDGSVQFEIFPTSLHLRRVDAACNMRRFFRMTVQRDLFGGASLVRVWGRIGTRGRQLVETHDDEGTAITALMVRAQEKRRRGYALPG